MSFPDTWCRITRSGFPSPFRSARETTRQLTSAGLASAEPLVTVTPSSIHA